MNFVVKYRSLTTALLLLTLAGGGLVLAGCEFHASDTLSNPPSSMPTPQSVSKGTNTKDTPAPLAVPTEQELGMPIYPNSTVYVDIMGKPIPPSITSSIATAMLSSIDGMDKVVEFYKKSIADTDSDGKRNPPSIHEETDNGIKKIMISGNDASGHVMMAIVHDDNGKAVIELMRTGGVHIPASVSGGASAPSGTTPGTTGATGTTPNGGTPDGATMPNTGSPGTPAMGSSTTPPGTSSVQPGSTSTNPGLKGSRVGNNVIQSGTGH